MAGMSTIMRKVKCLSQLILLLNWICSINMSMKFAMEPQDQSALIGSKVILPCRIENLKGVVQWTQNQFGLGTNRQLPGFDRYSMIGSDDEGDYSLEIRDVALEDDGLYQCQVSDRDMALRSNTAKLSVLVPPEPPIIQEALKPFNVSEDQVLQLTCISNGGKPSSEITWIDGLGNVVTDGISYTTKLLQDNYRFRTISQLRIATKRAYHQTTFKCQAQNTAERTHQTATIFINVTYAPKVTLSVISDRNENGQIVEGANIVIECNTDANPSNVSFRWFSNDKLLKKKRSNKLLISNITRDHHNNVIKCEANNSIGKSEESETLNIAYSPVFRSSTRTIAAEENKAVNLFCDVDSNPSAKISWFRENSLIVLSNNDTLSVIINRNSVGKYSCVAESKGFAPITTETIVLAKGPPKISAEPVVVGHIGDEVEMYCSAMTIPASEPMLWSLNGDSLTSYVQSGQVSITEHSFMGGVTSTLIIKELIQELLGEYRCSIHNQYGEDVFQISLAQNTQKSAIVMGFAVVGLGLAAVIVLVSFIVCCVKQCGKDATNKGISSDPEKHTESQHELQLTAKSKNDVKISIDGSVKAIEASNDSKYSSSSTVQIDSNFNDTKLLKMKSNQNLLRCQQYSNNIGIDNPYPDIGLPMGKQKPHNVQKKLDFSNISFTMYPKTSTYLQPSGGSLNNILSSTTTHQNGSEYQPAIPPKLGHRYSVTNEISATYRQVPQQVANATNPISSPNGGAQYPYITHLLPNYPMHNMHMQPQPHQQYLNQRPQHYSTLPLQNHIDNSLKRSYLNIDQNGANHTSTLPNVISGVLKQYPAHVTNPITATTSSTGLLVAPIAYHYNHLNNSNNDAANSLKKQMLVVVSSNDHNSRVIVNGSQNPDETIKTSTAVIV